MKILEFPILKMGIWKIENSHFFVCLFVCFPPFIKKGKKSGDAYIFTENYYILGGIPMSFFLYPWDWKSDQVLGNSL